MTILYPPNSQNPFSGVHENCNFGLHNYEFRDLKMFGSREDDFKHYMHYLVYPF